MPVVSVFEKDMLRLIYGHAVHSENSLEEKELFMVS